MNANPNFLSDVCIVILLRKPAVHRLRRFQEEQARQELSYSAVGASIDAARLPRGYNIDRTRVVVGRGEQAFEMAKIALKGWKHFQVGWVSVWPETTPLAVGEVLAVVIRTGVLWWLNSCRIVQVIDEPDRFGFAYGTLPEHAERGEELFQVHWDCITDEVWYEILAFSRPRHPLAWLGYPITRIAQHRFRQASALAMKRAVALGLKDRYSTMAHSGDSLESARQ